MENIFLSFDPALHQPQLFGAWKKFIKTGLIETGVVPVEIAESWVRSKESGVDPFNFKDSSYMNPEDYKRQIEKNQHLIKIASPIMDSIYNSLEKTRYLVVLYDACGYHLLRIGKREDFERSQEFRIRVGLCFEEQHVGTCGFSLAKKLKKSVKITGCEHYSALMHYVTGSYAPILSPDKREVIGVLGVAGAKTPPNDHTHAIVIAATTAIEDLLKLDKARQEQFIIAKSLHVAMDSLEDGVIIMNRDLRIIEMNSIARKIFGIKDFYGRHIIDLDQIEEIYRTVARHLESEDMAAEEVDCQIRERMYLAFIKLLGNDDRKVQGVIVQLKNIRKIAQIYQKISGEKPRYNLNNIIASSRSMVEIKNVIQVAAKTDACVIIEGESGSGKEVVAQCIHNESLRKNCPFVVINCAAIPHELVESTLFGHEKGSFTGADTTQIGKFEIAHQGTLFLDEIGEMSTAMQAKMLRAIETRKIERVGGRKTFSVDVRVIAATNKDIYELVRKNQFRADLFYRLNVFRIYLPPLRLRKDDLPLLVNAFLHEFALMFKIPIPKMSDDYLAALENYDWPGNVRELKNALQFSLAKLNEDDVLTADHLGGFFPSYGDSVDLSTADDRIKERHTVKEHDLHTIEKRVILNTIQTYKGNKTIAARVLGISRPTLYRKLRK